MTITGILLAAGQSHRFGNDKLLYPLKGTPIAVVSARKLGITVDQVLAVVRPESILLAQLLSREGLQIITCAAAQKGMGASLACGIKASPNAQAWVITLADMPFIQIATFNQLVTRLTQGAAIVAPTYQGRRGHPVGFNRQFKEPLSQLMGDVGARSVLQHYHTQITTFSCDDAGIHWDIDTPQDLKENDCGYIKYES